MWQEFGPNTYPLDIDALIEGAIQTSGYSGFVETKMQPFESLEGCLVRVNGEDRWNILLNQNIKNGRRLRFTQAHELGHFMCHRDQQDCFEDDINTLNEFSQDIELEANIFASWLLMPADILRNEFGSADWHVQTLCDLGNRFECSLQASALRFASISQKPIAFIVSRDGIILWATKSKSAPYVKAFVFGQVLPYGSQARKMYENRMLLSDRMASKHIWSDYHDCEESQYFDESGLGYQYTCIEFF